jgi:hypothetical protein
MPQAEGARCSEALAGPGGFPRSVRAIADSDRFHKTDLRSYTPRLWTLNQGSYGLRVNYLDQTVTIE